MLVKLSKYLLFSPLKDFLFNVSHALRLLSLGGVKDNGTLPENQDLTGALTTAQKEVFDALCGKILYDFT